MPPRRAIRFAVWIFAAIGALAFHSVWRAALACLIVILALLCSTPPNAIRLPRWISELFIVISTLAIDSHRPALPLGIHLGVLLAMLLLLRLWGKSPWWSVLYGWFPAW